jgi:trans-aconitate methyltransferase
VGCGTGALTQTILDLAQPSAVTGVDPSDAFLAGAREAVTDARALFDKADAHALPAISPVDAVVSGLVLNFLTDRGAALQQMTERTRTGGTIGAYVWDYAGRMAIMRHFWDAAVELDPAAAALDEGRRDSICNPDALIALFGGSLKAVEVTALDVPAVFPSFDAYWQPFLGGVGPAPAYAVSLSEEHREALRERLRGRVPASAGSKIELTCRAWAVKGLHA